MPDVTFLLKSTFFSNLRIKCLFSHTVICTLTQMNVVRYEQSRGDRKEADDRYAEEGTFIQSASLEFEFNSSRGQDSVWSRRKGLQTEVRTWAVFSSSEPLSPTMLFEVPSCPFSRSEIKSFLADTVMSMDGHTVLCPSGPFYSWGPLPHVTGPLLQLLRGAREPSENSRWQYPPVLFFPALI